MMKLTSNLKWHDSTVLSQQVPKGARSSSAKIWGWAVTRRRCLNSSTVSMQGPTANAKLTAMGLNGLASSVGPCFVEASPTVEKVVLCYKAVQLIASLLSFRSIQSSLAVCEYRAAGEVLERGHRRVCANLWCLMPWVRSASEQLQLCEVSGPTFRFTTHKFSMVGSYTENPEKQKKIVKSGVWELARDNTVPLVTYSSDM